VKTLTQAEDADFKAAAAKNLARIAEAERLLTFALAETTARRAVAERVFANCGWTAENHPDVARALLFEWQEGMPSAHETAAACLKAQVVV